MDNDQSASCSLVKFALTGQTFSLLASEDPDAFKRLLDLLVADLKPATEGEMLLVQQLTQHQWLAQRAINLQTDCWDKDGNLNDRRYSLAIRVLNTHERLARLCREHLVVVQRKRRSQAGFAAIAAQNPEIFGKPDNDDSRNGFVLQSELNKILGATSPTAESSPEPRRSSIPPKRKRIR